MDALVVAAALPAILLVRFFIDKDPGVEGPRHGVWPSVGFGVLSIIATLIVVVPVNYILFDDLIPETYFVNNTTDPIAYGYVFFNAAIEEVMKFIPLAIFIYKKPYFNKITDGVTYFAIAGLTFGSIETLLYAITEGGLITVLFRYGLGLFLHGALTATVGYVLASTKAHRKSFMLTLPVLLDAALLHTIYNLGIFMGPQSAVWYWVTALVSAGITACMFVLFYVGVKTDIYEGRSRFVVTLNR